MCPAAAQRARRFATISAAELGRVGRAGAEHELRGRVELARRVEQVREALLPRDAADEHDRRQRRGRSRARRAHPCPWSGRNSSVSIPLWITVDPSRLDRRVGARGCRRASPPETAMIASAFSSPVRSQKHERRVAAAELLLLPRPQRLEAVHGRDVRDPVDQLRQVPAEVRVPGVAVDERRRPRPRPPSPGRSRPRAAPPDAARCPRARPRAR